MYDTFRVSQHCFMLAGVLIIWFGFYGFNCGSVGSFFPRKEALVARVAVNTTAACVTGIIYIQYNILICVYVSVCMYVYYTPGGVFAMLFSLVIFRAVLVCILYI